MGARVCSARRWSDMVVGPAGATPAWSPCERTEDPLGPKAFFRPDLTSEAPRPLKDALAAPQRSAWRASYRAGRELGRPANLSHRPPLRHRLQHIARPADPGKGGQPTSWTDSGRLGGAIVGWRTRRGECGPRFTRPQRPAGIDTGPLGEVRGRGGPDGRSAYQAVQGVPAGHGGSRRPQPRQPLRNGDRAVGEVDGHEPVAARRPWRRASSWRADVPARKCPAQHGSRSFPSRRRAPAGRRFAGGRAGTGTVWTDLASSAAARRREVIVMADRRGARLEARNQYARRPDRGGAYRSPKRECPTPLVRGQAERWPMPSPHRVSRPQKLHKQPRLYSYTNGTVQPT